MIKRILVALDPDQDTRAATHYATEIAHRHQAETVGLAVIDTRQLAVEIGGTGVGTMYMEEVLRTRRTEAAQRTAQELTQAFGAAEDAALVPHEELIEEGAPYQHILDELRYADLLVIGREPHFLYTRPDVPTDTVLDVLRAAPAPVLVAASTYRPVRRAMVAFDASDAAVRALHAFAEMQPFGAEIEVEVVHVRPADDPNAQQRSDQMLGRAVQFLRRHGFGLVSGTSLPYGPAGERLVAYAAAQRTDLLVAGAHSASAVHRLVYGSTTRVLLEDSPVSVFIVH